MTDIWQSTYLNSTTRHQTITADIWLIKDHWYVILAAAPTSTPPGGRRFSPLPARPGCWPCPPTYHARLPTLTNRHDVYAYRRDDRRGNRAGRIYAPRAARRRQKCRNPTLRLPWTPMPTHFFARPAIYTYNDPTIDDRERTQPAQSPAHTTSRGDGSRTGISSIHHPYTHTYIPRPRPHTYQVQCLQLPTYNIQHDGVYGKMASGYTYHRPTPNRPAAGQEDLTDEDEDDATTFLLI